MPSEKEDFADFLDTDFTKEYFVFLHDAQIIGCGGIFVDPGKNSAGLAWGMIDAAWQSKGFGKQFTIFRLKLLKERYPGYLYRIDTSQHTEGFYEKLGFKTVSVEPEGYGPGMDKHIMETRDFILNLPYA